MVVLVVMENGDGGGLLQPVRIARRYVDLSRIIQLYNSTRIHTNMGNENAGLGEGRNLQAASEIMVPCSSMLL